MVPHCMLQSGNGHRGHGGRKQEGCFSTYLNTIKSLLKKKKKKDTHTQSMPPAHFSTVLITLRMPAPALTPSCFVCDSPFPPRAAGWGRWMGSHSHFVTDRRAHCVEK